MLRDDAGAAALGSSADLEREARRIICRAMFLRRVIAYARLVPSRAGNTLAILSRDGTDKT